MIGRSARHDGYSPATIVALLLSVATLAAAPARAEHEPGPEEHAGEAEEARPPHRISFSPGYTWVPDGVLGDTSGPVIIPTLAIDYEYWFSHRWAIGIFNDFELASYVVETESETFVREFAYILTVGAVYEFVPAWAAIVGVGREFEDHHSFWLLKLAAAWETPIRNNWDLSVEGGTDIKEEYPSFYLRLAVGKRFGGGGRGSH